MFRGFLILFFASCLQFSESLTLHMERDKTYFNLSSGVSSQINFYVDGVTRNTKDIRIFIQHRALKKESFDTKCIVAMSTNRVCNSTDEICRCLGDTAERIEFSLEKLFAEDDAGVWLFFVWQYEDARRNVTINVVGSVSSTQTSYFSTSSTVHATQVSTGTLAQETTIRSTKQTLSSRRAERSTTKKAVRYTSQSSEGASTIITTSATTTNDVANVSVSSGKEAASYHTDPEETNNHLILIIAIVVVVTAHVIAFSVVLWRHPGLISRLRRGRNLDSRRTALYAEGDALYAASYDSAPACDTGERDSSGYLTPVWDPNSYAVPNSQTASAASPLAAHTPSVSRENSRRSNIFSIFEQKIRGDTSDDIYQTVKLSRAACTFVNPSVVPCSGDGTLTLSLDPKPRVAQAPLTKIFQGLRAPTPSQKTACSSDTDDDESCGSHESSTNPSVHRDHGTYMTPVLVPTTTTSSTGKGKLSSASKNQTPNEACTGSTEMKGNNPCHDDDHGTYMTPVHLPPSQSNYPQPRTSL